MGRGTKSVFFSRQVGNLSQKKEAGGVAAPPVRSEGLGDLGRGRRPPGIAAKGVNGEKRL